MGRTLFAGRALPAGGWAAPGIFSSISFQPNGSLVSTKAPNQGLFGFNLMSSNSYVVREGLSGR